MTAPDLADVLAEVNRLRAERGMEPLSEMPKGTPYSLCECPVARAIEGTASRAYLIVGRMADFKSGDWRWGLEANPDQIQAPAVISRFIAHFDMTDAYPELVAS